MKSKIIFGVLLLSTAIAQAQFQLNGVATNLGGGTYQLTPAAINQFGAIWYKLQHNLDNSFNVQGQFNFGGDPAGADGITFIMQNSCLSAGGAGGGIGYSGIPGSSIGIEFDTYQNIAGTGAELNNDPTFDHIAVEINGDVVHDGSATDITAPIQMDPVLTNVKTGSWYNYQISYNAATKNLRVTFNGSLRVNITYDLKNNVFGGNPWVYWGFASSTGGFTNVHQLSINGTISTHLLADTTICTGSIPITLNPFTNLRGTNLALRNPATASTNSAAEAVDGNMGSRWESVFADPQWLQVDLQSPTDIDSVVIYWEPAYASGYEIQTSNDAITWTTRFATTTGDGGKDKIVFSATNIRYVRMYGTVRATGWGYSIWEFQVYGQPHYLWSPNNGTISPDIYASSVVLTPTVTTTYSVLVPDTCLGYTTASMTVTINCAMPVDILSFSAEKENDRGLLHWTTASEVNTSHFKIWKSTNGGEYQFIGTQDAAGHSQAPRIYSFQDPGTLSGITYYRLVPVDLDGTEQPGQTAVLESSGKPIVAPSVFEDETILYVPAGVTKLEYSIVNIAGQLLEAEKLEDVHAMAIGGGLPAGAYVVLVKTGSELTTIRISKF